MDQPTINSVLLALLTFIMSAFFAVWFRSTGQRQKWMDDVIARLVSIEKANVGYDIKLIPLWAKAQKDLSETLHHPHAKDQEADELLDKLEMHPDEMTVEETDRLKNLMLQRSMDTTISVQERRAATVMPLIMDMVFEIGYDTTDMKAEPVGIEDKTGGGESDPD